MTRLYIRLNTFGNFTCFLKALYMSLMNRSNFRSLIYLFRHDFDSFYKKIAIYFEGYFQKMMIRWRSINIKDYMVLIPQNRNLLSSRNAREFSLQILHFCIVFRWKILKFLVSSKFELCQDLPCYGEEMLECQASVTIIPLYRNFEIISWNSF